MNAFHKPWVPRLLIMGLLAAGVLALLAVSSTAQEKKLKKEPVKVTSPASGEEMFTSYCVACHGKDAKGDDGPAAAALKTAPADLTTLARRNNGKYPEARVASVLRGQRSLASHGDQEMPVWGPGVPEHGRGHEDEVQMRIANLNRYLETLQVK